MRYGTYDQMLAMTRGAEVAKDKDKDKETEEKVRRALKGKAAEVKPDPDALKKIRERTGRRKKSLR